ncbi:MAG: rhodanese-like domain-containing protein [Actinomycetota bacterium]|nr:rhodanese-like domain-containing protein [Actinomycetota bacterium]
MATVDELLALARARLVRVSPTAAAARRRAGALLVDLRLIDQRAADGSVPGALILSLNHLEWRLDPNSPDRIEQARDHDVDIVLLCDEGYCSSLAAARLLDLGLHRATDVDGGFQAWRAAGLPVEQSAE